MLRPRRLNRRWASSLRILRTKSTTSSPRRISMRFVPTPIQMGRKPTAATTMSAAAAAKSTHQDSALSAPMIDEAIDALLWSDDDADEQDQNETGALDAARPDFSSFHHDKNVTAAAQMVTEGGEQANQEGGEETDSTMTIRTDAGGPIVRSAPLPGGLSNLGNTCYMASALQMIASLESFVDRLQDTAPEAPASDLRAHLLDTLRCLARGDTVRPNQLKEAIDERSPLFTGYRQQDAHEFLTTLLDLLDEDYKREETGPEEQEEQQQQEEVIDTAEAGEKAEETASAEPEEATEDAMEVEQTAVVEPYSPSKKARTEEPSSSSDDSSSNVEMEESSESSALEGLLKLSAPLNEFHQSFSELDVDAIGRLLHGNSDDTLLPPEVSTVSTSPVSVSPYKLVGGRMNTADVVLTPYGNEDDDYNSNSNESQQAHPSLATTPNTASPNTSMVSDDEDDEPDKVLSPIDETFTTQVRVRLTCDSCKYTRCHKETFWHLSLEIGENTATTIEDGLRKFFGPCRNEVKCEKCFGETATQTTEITSLPPALLLHFKRFIVDVSPDYTEISYRKNRSTVLYDPVLAVAEEEGGILSEFLAPDCVLPKSSSSSSSTRKNNKKSGHDNAGTSSSSSPKYNLRSVVNHIGSSASCGHYTADAAIIQQQTTRAAAVDPFQRFLRVAHLGDRGD